MLASIGLMFSSIIYLKSIGQGSLAALTLMGIPVFTTVSAVQIADVPVTYFILASCILMYMHLTEKNTAFLLLSGFMAGLAGWTKNEGLQFALISLLVLLLTTHGHLFKETLQYLVGLLIPMICIVYFKSIAPANDLFVGDFSDAFARFLDITRYQLVIAHSTSSILRFGGWPISMFLFLCIYAVIVRPGFPAPLNRGVLVIATLIVLQLLGYAAIYILTPHELSWHLETSLERLLLQACPVLIFLFFNVVETPEDLFEKEVKIDASVKNRIAEK